MRAIERPTWHRLPFGQHLLAESPRWDAALGSLWWVDIGTGSVFTAARDRRGNWSLPTKLDLSEPATAAEPVPGGPAAANDDTLVDVCAGGLVLRTNLDGGVVRRLEVARDHPRVRTNDCIRDAHGRLVVGLFAEDRASALGGLVVCDAGLSSAQPLVVGMVTANGLAFDRTGTRLHVVDTARGTVSAHSYDPDAGRAGPGRVLYSHAGPGRLDGLVRLPGGDLLVAVWDEGVLLRLTPAGDLCSMVGAPSPRPTAMALLPAPRRLVLTTADGPHGSRDPGGLYETEELPG